MAKPRKIAELLKQYHSRKTTFEGLAKTAESILQNLLKKERIPFVSVSSRVKTSESLIEKQRRRRYKDPTTEITDVVGIRVIIYTEDDAARVCELVKSTFSIDPIHSIDKGKELEVDQIGYRSYHFTCDLGNRRVALPEFQAFTGMQFEVQVRTILQHAWAEVEHDRNYKFSGVLPAALQRRLFLISGVLEMGDRELNQLSRDIDAYAADVEERAREGKLKGEELNSTTLRAFIPELASGLKRAKMYYNADPDTLTNVIEECRAFGLKTTTDLKTLFTKELFAAIDEFQKDTNEAGLTRDAMIYSDITRYFADAWKKHWTGIDTGSVQTFANKYGIEKVRELLKKYAIDMEDVDTVETV
jgi:putative GTP pyrophosphokinase